MTIPLEGVETVALSSLKENTGKYAAALAGSMSAASVSCSATVYGAAVGAWVGSVVPVAGTIIGAGVGAASAAALSVPCSLAWAGMSGLGVNAAANKIRSCRSPEAEVTEAPTETAAVNDTSDA